MNEDGSFPPGEDDDEVDEIAHFVQQQNITVRCSRVDVRPDVSRAELESWQQQDPDYPLEHYRCFICRADKELEVYQTVGADYPDEDEESNNSDLYCDNRDLLLSAEFLIESAALKANSIDEAEDVESWIVIGYCETETPNETFEQYRQLRNKLYDLMGESLYRIVVRLAVAAEMERDEESEELT